MEKQREKRKAYAAPTVEFHAVIQDIIMCSGNQYGNNVNNVNNDNGGNNGSNNGGWPWWPWWLWG